MAKTTLAGHPLHPQLISAPSALLPFSLVMDLMYDMTGDESYADAAYYSMMGGYLGGAAAGLAGAGDYADIPPESHTKQIANLHASLNIGIMGLYSLNLLMRRDRRPRTGKLPMLLSAVGTAGLFISAWYGGHMVYEHGMRVKGVSPVADGPEMKLPGDKQIERPFSMLEEVAPVDGPRA